MPVSHVSCPSPLRFRRLIRTATRYPPLRLDTYKEEDDDEDDEDLDASIFDLSGITGATSSPIVYVPTAGPTQVEPEGTADVTASSYDRLAAFYAQSPLTPTSVPTSSQTSERQQSALEQSCVGSSAAVE